MSYGTFNRLSIAEGWPESCEKYPPPLLPRLQPSKGNRIAPSSRFDHNVFCYRHSSRLPVSYRILGRIISVALALACGSGGSALAADIRSTPHNLTGKKDDGSRLDEREVCVFCHTPTVDVSGASGVGKIPENAPHWQSHLPREHAFVIYDDIGRLGLGKDSVGSQSVACLSCHDSVQAFGASKSVNDHPFGVPYRGSLKQRGPQSSMMAQKPADSPSPYRQAQHLVALEDFRDASHGIVENRTIWWVSSSGITARRTRNDLPLYPRQEGDDASAPEVPHIECSSCHDPHNSRETFLRVSNSASALCLTCHSK